MIILGLTGPTGAGKGEVTARLKRLGILVIDTDGIAREVVKKGSPCLAALAEAFGDDILHQDGTLNRAALAARAFATPEAEQRLNAITHPYIIRRSLDILENSTAYGAVIDAPLLFESGMDAYCHTTAAVLAPAEMRLSRIMARDGISKEQALLRMNAQPDETYYRERAMHILINDKDTAALDAAVQALVRTVWRDAL